MVAVASASDNAAYRLTASTSSGSVWLATACAACDRARSALKATLPRISAPMMTSTDASPSRPGVLVSCPRTQAGTEPSDGRVVRARAPVRLGACLGTCSPRG